ncbi:hypothetical protein [Streptomyces flavidovirens]|uniref:HTH cro/C1-type domain-containing protein n=1 Tax=Streptomyces flavidovirens TaxID=67298 RepID=A0ABW6R918_9ACTN
MPFVILWNLGGEDACQLDPGAARRTGGIDRKTVYRAELATRTPSYERVFRIAYALGGPLSDLVRQ